MRRHASLLSATAAAAAAAAASAPLAALRIAPTPACPASAIAAAFPAAERPGRRCGHGGDELEAGGGGEYHLTAGAGAARRAAAMGCGVVRGAATRGLNATAGAPPAGYTPPAQLLRQYEDLQRAHPDLARWVDVTAEYAAPPTQDGNHLHMLKVSDNVGDDEDEPNVLLYTGIHAREVIGPELNYFIAARLLTEYATNAEIRSIVDRFQVYIVMTGNPDGFHYVWETDATWRKNRRPNPDGSFGVDMNRNFPFGWDLAHCRGSDEYPSGNYRGPGPASEPEVQTILALREDRNFDRIFESHTGCGPDVRYNYARADMQPEEIDDFGIRVAGVLAAEMGIPAVRSLNCGTELSDAHHNGGSLSVLSEVARAHQPDAEEMRRVLQTSWPGVFDFLRRPTPVSGRVVDGITRRGVGGARLSLPDLDFTFGEVKRGSNAGRFHLWLPEGPWRVTVAVPGYAPSNVTLLASTEGEWAEVPVFPDKR